MTLLNVDGIGAFELHRRTLRNEIKIGAEFNRLTEGQETLSEWFRDLCEMVSYLKVMVAKAPAGWSLDEMDPDPEGYRQIMDVYRAARLAEASKSP